MKTEYEVEEQVDSIDASIEKAKSQLSETTMLKQFENQIELLKEQIHSARMNDAHYDQRARTIDSRVRYREEAAERTGGRAGCDPCPAGREDEA